MNKTLSLIAAFALAASVGFAQVGEIASTTGATAPLHLSPELT